MSHYIGTVLLLKPACSAVYYISRYWLVLVLTWFSPGSAPAPSSLDWLVNGLSFRFWRQVGVGFCLFDLCHAHPKVHSADAMCTVRAGRVSQCFLVCFQQADMVRRSTMAEVQVFQHPLQVRLRTTSCLSSCLQVISRALITLEGLPVSTLQLISRPR